MNANTKVSEQYRIAASKGNQILGMIRRNITYKDKSLIVPVYKATVRPHLEYCIQAWSPVVVRLRDIVTISDGQFGFKSGVGTTDAIFVICVRNTGRAISL